MPRKISGFEMYECTCIVPTAELGKIVDELGRFTTHVRRKIEKNLFLQRRPSNHYSIRRKYQCATFSYFFLFSINCLLKIRIKEKKVYFWRKFLVCFLGFSLVYSKKNNILSIWNLYMKEIHEEEYAMNFIRSCCPTIFRKV